jgi:transcriptional regulator NrdR family protein
MECPRCGNTGFHTYDTKNIGGGKVRIRKCVGTEESRGCGLAFRTHESIIQVEVFNPNTLKTEKVDLTKYKKDHLDNELKGMSGFQQRMFRE